MKVGVLLVNLGTPAEPTAVSIKNYLKQFLSDKRVIELPKLIWWPILNGPILMFRPRKLVEKYKSIWLPSGSPLWVYGRQLQTKIEQELALNEVEVKIELGMRYGQPDSQLVLQQMVADGCERILVIPMYPQYSAATTATAVDHITQAMRGMRNQPEVRFIKRFYQEPGFIEATAAKIKHHWQQYGVPDTLLLSYHGLPKRCVEKGDPYAMDCAMTTRLIAQQLASFKVPVEMSYQSRFGTQKWVGPSTDELIPQLVQKGIKRLDVHSPCFVSDCLETLEEINIQYRELFFKTGGKEFNYIECLNADSQWAKGLTKIILKHLQGWC